MLVTLADDVGEIWETSAVKIGARRGENLDYWGEGSIAWYG